MLTLAKIALISSLFISLPFGRPQKQNLRRNVTQHTIEDVKTMRNKSIHLERRINATSENRSDISNLMVTAPSLLDLSTTFKATNSSRNFPTASSTESPKPPSTHSIPPLVQGFVSKLPLNSSVADVNPLQVSEHSNSTHSPLSGNFTWSLDNDTMNSPKDMSSTVSLFPPPPKTTPVTPFTAEPNGWFGTNDNFAGFTPYQEKTTLQPTLKFTNNSKLFPNASDTPKETKNTGIVFGAILGAILGASLLSLVGYLLCGQRKTDSFSHQRLYDDRNEPVLRLDNAPEPYDVNFGNSSYYNRAVSDSSMPEGGESAHDSIPMDAIPPLRTSM
ncbi:mucin-15 isoform X1 [Rattus norvegicus]|uniref:Mucin 15, cell surface associated n=1 Tax=Rattus norvegicus TaxID=10116 RepID=Q5XHX5_RAT|nr:mucin-15 precursor [Rattus norvegicus]XP_006234757.1 mucin-15 isoform X1 [Rattus norvegicus]AAH83925.1 Mucin 15, cell surface associated [Rattus norvegicus]|eukprot:NP_001037766.1 mucin-15 precursor [Rattus norvegicus]